MANLIKRLDISNPVKSINVSDKFYVNLYGCLRSCLLLVLIFCNSLDFYKLVLFVGCLELICRYPLMYIFPLFVDIKEHRCYNEFAIFVKDIAIYDFVNNRIYIDVDNNSEISVYIHELFHSVYDQSLMKVFSHYICLILYNGYDMFSEFYAQTYTIIYMKMYKINKELPVWDYECYYNKTNNRFRNFVGNFITYVLYKVWEVIHCLLVNVYK
jgi:hypothetical protein